MLIGAALVPLLGLLWLTCLAFYLTALLLFELDRRWWLWALGAVIAAYVAVAPALGAAAGALLDSTVQLAMVGALEAAFFRQLQDGAALRLARAELARLAVAEERLRISRDLHDVLGQELSAVALKAQLSARLVHTDPARAGAESAEVVRIARHALDEMRATVSGYRDTSLASEVRTASALLGAVGITVTVSGVPVGLPAAIAETAAWVVRETSTNIVRHARAGHCRITLGRTAEGLLVQVQDDGGATVVRPGNGLTGLTERIAALGGSLTTGPVDGWFTVEARLPAGGTG